MQVGVEDYCDVADQQAAECFHAQVLSVEGEQSVLRECFECLPFCGEVLPCIDGVFFADGVEVEVQVAHDFGDDVLADVVIMIERHAAQHGQATGV